MKTTFLKKNMDVFKNTNIYVTWVNETHEVMPDPGAYHSHDFWEFELFIEGNGIHDINQTQHEIKRGYCYLLTPADYHRLHYPANTRLFYYNIKFDDYILDTALRQKIYSHATPLHAYVDDRTTNELHRLILYLASVTQDEERINTDVPRRILALIATIFETNLNPGDIIDEHKNANLQAAIIFLQQNFKRKLTREAVAKVANMSPCYFSDYFKKEVGVSFVQYLNDVRIKYAEMQMQYTHMSLKEISYASGFSSFGTFVNAFKRKHGIPPSEFISKKHSTGSTDAKS